MGRRQPRIYALTCQDAQLSNTMVTSTLPVCSFDAHVLFDLGSTNSYVSLYFAFWFSQPPSRLD